MRDTYKICHKALHDDINSDYHMMLILNEVTVGQFLKHTVNQYLSTTGIIIVTVETVCIV